MATLRIYDLDRHALAFDLRHLIDLLAPRSLKARWTISTVKSPDPGHEWFEATGKGGDELEHLARTGEEIDGAALALLARDTRQVIWGKFIGVQGTDDRGWITIRAIDSSFYEITSTDETVLRKIRSTYKDVRSAEHPYD